MYALIFWSFPCISSFIATQDNWVRYLTWPLLMASLVVKEMSNVLCFTSVMIMVRSSI
jgi:hypothetical protein